MTLVAGVDSSTSATKVEVRDVDDGRVVASGSRPHVTTQPPRSEQDPAGLVGGASKAPGPTPAFPDVAAIAVAGQQHGMVVLDADRHVVRPAKLWNDTESAADAAWLLDQLDGGAAAWAEACGSVPVAAFTITKLSWLHRKEPESWDRLAHVVPAARLADVPAHRSSRHRSWRRIGHGLLVAAHGHVPLGPARHRRRRPGLVVGGARCARSAGAGGDLARRGRGARDRRQHGRRARRRAAAGRRRHLHRHVGHGVRRQRSPDGGPVGRGRRVRRRLRAASSRWSAR